jgi:hypothetical protein
MKKKKNEDLRALRFKAACYSLKSLLEKIPKQIQEKALHS